jgi:hypothetical protein
MHWVQQSKRKFRHRQEHLVACCNIRGYIDATYAVYIEKRREQRKDVKRRSHCSTSFYAFGQDSRSNRTRFLSHHDKRSIQYHIVTHGDFKWAKGLHDWTIHFPTQNPLNISPNTSSTPTTPTILPNSPRA